MSDNGSLPCNINVKTEVEVKEEPLEEDENDKNNGEPLQQCSNDNQQVEYAEPNVENIAYGEMQNEEVLPDSFPVPIGYPVCIKEEENENASFTSQMQDTVSSKTSPDDMAEKQKQLPGTSESDVNINDGSKLLHKKQKLVLMENIPEDKDELQFPNVRQGFNFNIPAIASSPPHLLSSADSIPSSSTPLLLPYVESPTSRQTSTQKSLASQGHSTSNLQSTPASLSSSPSSSAPAVDDQQCRDDVMRTERKKAKRNCPMEALNVVQEILLNPTPCHVYHLRSLATFMTERMHTMNARKRKRVENHLIQLILKEDL